MSQKDVDNLKDQLDISNLNISLNNFLIMNLDQIWKSYYDINIKNKNIATLKKMLNSYIKDMNFVLKELSRENYNEEKIIDINNEIKLQKEHFNNEILFLKSKVKPFGNIIDYKVINNRAMIVVNFKYIFDKYSYEYFKKIKTETLGLKIINFAAPNILNVYYVLSFEKDIFGEWKIMLFSRELFDNTGFEDFIEKYEQTDPNNLYYN